MTTLKVKIETLEQTMAKLADAFKAAEAAEAATECDAESILSFPSWELMHRVLAPKRLDILKVMAGQGNLSIREIARRVDRDFKGVHSDIVMLLSSGIIDRTAQGGVEFPYDRIQFEFAIEAAA